MKTSSVTFEEYIFICSCIHDLLFYYRKWTYSEVFFKGFVFAFTIPLIFSGITKAHVIVEHICQRLAAISSFFVFFLNLHLLALIIICYDRNGLMFLNVYFLKINLLHFIAVLLWKQFWYFSQRLQIECS